MKKYNKEYLFEAGAMWEGGTWAIYTEYTCSTTGGGSPCSHCHSVESRPSSQKHPDLTWVCPTVVVLKNEGGWNSTGLCLDCLNEAQRKVTK